MKRWLSNTIPIWWTRRFWLTYALLPFSYGFRLVAYLRRLYFRYYFTPEKLFVPVIVVGNISVGGTGKTPFVIALTQAMKEKGYTPGIITRGYKSNLPKHAVALVDTFSQASELGDEALVLFHQTQSPVSVGRNRVKAAQHLLQLHPEVDVLISDDGLQHYALKRDIEIAIVDAKRRLGNGFCLPAGPLREPPVRLASVDFVVTNGGSSEEAWPMSVTFGEWVCRVNEPSDRLSLAGLGGETTRISHAVAGLGSPDRFFNMLEQRGIKIIKHPFPDHYAYQKSDLIFPSKDPILMTEKDAVKCRGIAPENAWYLTIKASFDDKLVHSIIEKITHGQKTT